MPSKINIIFASDNHYIQHLATALTSLFENTAHSNKIVINIIDGGISKENKIFLKQLVERYDSILQFKKINNNILKGLVINGHITEATYYRILIPSLFGEDVTKAIYLDCDIIVCADIIDFWIQDIRSFALGAIRFYEFNGQALLGIPREASYFNAGVLLMNLEKWRENNISSKVLDFIAKYPERLISWDQDALNGVLYNDWVEIDMKWNLRSQLFEYDYIKAGLPSEEEFNELKRNPSIVHFTTASKPWHYLNNHPFKADYFYYLNKSGYNYEKYPEKSVILSKDIVLFGAGNKAIETTKELSEYDLVPSFYVDNDTNKWGTIFEGKEVKNPNCLTENRDKTLIIIASQYMEEIKEQLNKMGLLENQHYVKEIVYLSLLRKEN